MYERTDFHGDTGHRARDVEVSTPTPPQPRKRKDALPRVVDVDEYLAATASQSVKEILEFLAVQGYIETCRGPRGLTEELVESANLDFEVAGLPKRLTWQDKWKNELYLK